MKKNLLIILFFSIFLISCTNSPVPDYTETDMSGSNLTEVEDETLASDNSDSKSVNINDVNDENYSCTYESGILNINDYEIILSNKSFKLIDNRMSAILYHENIDCYNFNNSDMNILFMSNKDCNISNIYYELIYGEYKRNLTKGINSEILISVDKYTYDNRDYVCHYALVDKNHLYGLMLLRNNINDGSMDDALFCFELNKTDNSELTGSDVCDTLSRILANSSARIVGSMDLSCTLDESGYLNVFNSIEKNLPIDKYTKVISP